MFEKNLKNLLGTQKKKSKKNRRKNDVFFFLKFQRTKIFLQPDLFIFLIFFRFFIFSALNSIPLIKAPGSGRVTLPQPQPPWVGHY